MTDFLADRAAPSDSFLSVNDTVIDVPEPAQNLGPITVQLPNDYSVERDGVRYAGTHLIVDLWGARRLDDIAFIEEVMRDCVAASGATLLHIHLHHFTENGGVSGVAVLAESHISIHSWPEFDYAAMDVFMCGETEPLRAVEVLREAFQPDRIEVGEHHRGRL